MEKEIMISCSFCGKDVPCTKDFEKADKHACFDCFKNLQDKLPEEELGKVHVAIPKEEAKRMLPEIIINQLMAETFPSYWSDKKSELKDLSKRDIAEKAFMTGAISVFAAIEGVGKDLEEETK